MQFRVPQFIDVEDKIFGPFTFKQFIYLAGGAGICYVLWQTMPTFIAILLILPVAALALALAFYKVNGKPFIQVMEAYFSYIGQSKLYLWKRDRVRKVEKRETIEEKITTPAPKLSGSKLKDIAWSLDVLDMKQRGELEKTK